MLLGIPLGKEIRLLRIGIESPSVVPFGFDQLGSVAVDTSKSTWIVDSVVVRRNADDWSFEYQSSRVHNNAESSYLATYLPSDAALYSYGGNLPCIVAWHTKVA